MHTVFRLPWSTESPGDKIMEKAALHKPRPLPVVEMPNFMTKLKRKRTDSPEPSSPQHAHVLKKWKSAQGEVKPAVVAPGVADRAGLVDGVVMGPTNFAEPQETSKAASADVLESRPMAHPAKREGTSKSKAAKAQKSIASADPSSTIQPIPTMSAGLTDLQKALEAQFDYEILLKHNELRLIEQELAKCQISLEQLRRCSLVPFPGTEGLSQDVSSGAGAALQPPSGHTTPQYAAPWGVTDGPYTRHYAKWLLPDAKFDSMPERLLMQRSQGYFGLGEGRATRGSFADFGSASRSRTSRVSTGTLKLQALGENPAPTPKVDPLLHKRSTDGQLVRLFCSQCGHSNFSNTQGFLNHCRIKHNQVFKSHDMAAIACGVPVDASEAGNPAPPTEPPSTTATTPATSFPPPTTPGFVHPLIRSDPAEMAKDVHRDFSKASLDSSRPDTVLPKSGFATSATTPHMSALLRKRGFEGDLESMVQAARTKIDLSTVDVSDDESAESVAPTPVTATGQHQTSRLPAAPSQQRSLQLPSPVSLATTSSGNGLCMPDSPLDLSPHPVESNPGLVSDHDDDDDEDGDDARSHVDIVMADDVVVEDGSDVEGVHERKGSRKGLGGCFEKAEGSRKH